MVSAAVPISLIIAVISVIAYHKVKSLFAVPPIPAFKDEWWGPGEPEPIDQTIRNFTMDVSDEILYDLKERLDRTLPFQKPLEGVKHHYGINTKLLEDVIDFWKNRYDWKEREKYLNKYPQFIVNIQGLNIHFLHIKPNATNGVKVLPLLVLHGWLGSVREMFDLIPLLTTPKDGRDFVFEVVVPSLPGFAFSQGASKPNLGAFHIGVIMKNLMLRIGFKNFYVQGTDWGAAIVQHMSVLFPQHVIAMHSNMCIVSSPLSMVKTFIYSLYPKLFVEEQEHKYLDLMFPVTKIMSYRILETGYFHIQATKPDTVGVALRESPAGLAAYMLEKYITLTNPAYKDLDDGALNKTYGFTMLIDNIMIYWVTRSITTSMRIYSEQWNKFNIEHFYIESIPITIPTGCARFKYDVVFYPQSIMKEIYANLIHLTYHEAGHFPALEVPEILAEDIFTFFDKLNKL